MSKKPNVKNSVSSEEKEELYYYNSDSLSDDDSENAEKIEKYRPKDESSSYEDLSEEEIIYKHSLQHPLHYQTARKRRQRHLKNREGQVPSLHFMGTHKTDFWRRYGVDPGAVTPSGNTKAVDSLFTEDEFEKLGGSIERRIHINGQKFKIVSNEKFSKNMYRAISHALGMSEDALNFLQDKIHEELLNHWPIFYSEICKYSGVKLSNFDPRGDNPRKIVEKYKKHKRKKEITDSTSPEFELMAAALKFGFTYAVMELPSSNEAISVTNCNHEKVLQNASTKYHFLKTGNHSQSICYEFLLPIGPPKRIHSGKYPARLCDVILIEKSRPSNTSIQPRPDLGSIPVGFALDHRVFFHRSTISHDLWSLLAEVMYKKLDQAPQIKQKVIDSKHSFALYYFACKAKKRYQVHGSASIEKIADGFSRRFSNENPRGGVEDLAQAAEYFDFSFTLIGVDARLNFYWKDYVSSYNHNTNKRKGPYYAFFVKTLPNKIRFWYALEDVGRDCPKEMKLYQDTQAGDLRHWNGNFYFHYTPKIENFPTAWNDFSAWRIIDAPTKIMRNTATLASTYLGKLHSTLISITSVVSVLPRAGRAVFRSFLSGFKWMSRNRRIGPHKTVQELFVRDKP